ncbi:heterokaryon incompatibility protein-domain-containing protein [Cladorrhinum sp. PSN332]|nr:heterokaryon incompatibility protein-domain-containing protein [Cladorrhinum sp. PSN332]
MEVKGYAIKPNAWFGYLSMAILLIHALIAIGHLCVLIVAPCIKQGVVFGNMWESVPELLALALNLEPPTLRGEHGLENTCAGIDRGPALRLTSWIEDVGNAAGHGTEQLQLRLGTARRMAGGYKRKQGTTITPARFVISPLCVLAAPFGEIFIEKKALSERRVLSAQECQADKQVLCLSPRLIGRRVAPDLRSAADLFSSRPEAETCPTQNVNSGEPFIDLDLTGDGLTTLAELYNEPEDKVRDRLQSATDLESRIALNQFMTGEDVNPLLRTLARLHLGNDATEEQIEKYLRTHKLELELISDSDTQNQKSVASLHFETPGCEPTLGHALRQYGIQNHEKQQPSGVPSSEEYKPADDEASLDGNDGGQALDHNQLDQPFVYKPLKEGHIRLLQVLPAHPLKPKALNIRIQHYPLSSAPKYYALSYVWKTPGFVDERSTAVLGGRTKEATVSLLAALTRIWQWRDDLFIWADGVCINQDDIAERNAQVCLMGAIYSRAVCTLAYLGEPIVAADQGSISPDQAPFALIQMVLRVWERTPRYCRGLLRPDSDWETLNLPGIDEVTDQKLLVDIYAPWIALLMLCWQPWFTRAWVIQEVALAKEVLVFYGRAVNNLTNLSRFWTGAYDLPPMMRYGPLADLLGLIENSSQLDVFHSLQQVGRERAEELSTNGPPSGREDEKQVSTARTRSQFTNSTLLALLNMTRRAGATDLRDRVYSLLSLASDVSSLGISPDYSPANTAGKVFRQVAEIYIHQGRGVQVLYQAGLQHYDDDKIPGEEDPTETKALPSWVPDWSQAARRPLKEQKYRCMSDTTAPEIQISEDTLVVRGAVIDQVFFPSIRLDFEQQRMVSFEAMPRRKFYQDYSDLGPGLPPPEAKEGWTAALQLMNIAEQMASGLFINASRYEPTGEDIRRAVWRTMRADTSWRQARKHWAHDDGDDDGEADDDEIDEAAFNAYVRYGPSNLFLTDLHPSFDYRSLRSQAWPLAASIMRVAQGYCFGITACGRFGLFPASIRMGDLVAVVPGATMPFVLRPVKLDRSEDAKSDNGKRFVLVGPCYIHGIMYGEVLSRYEGEQEEDLEELPHDAEGQRYRVALRPWMDIIGERAKRRDFFDPDESSYAKMEDLCMV